MSQTINFNKKMIGKKVIVVNSGEEIKGKIVDVVDEENFLVEVSKTKENIEVSMYDIRSPESA
tara:strand:- start:214 stop:402 length:189 start_codon:yes stop_codon:yes gene_type:complete